MICLPKVIFKCFVSGLLFLIVLLLAAFAVLRSSTSALEFVLEETVSRVLNREFNIREIREAELSWDSYFLIRGASLANPEWAKEPTFVRVGQLLLRINLPSIWRDGPILITELELTDIAVNLLAPEDSPANWDFWPDDGEHNLSEVADDLDKKLQPVFPIQILHGRIDQGQLVYRDGERDVEFLIEELTLGETDDDAQISLNLAGTLNDLPLKVTGKLGPTSALLTRRHLTMDLVASLGKLELQAKGTIEDLDNFSGPDLHLTIAAPHSRPLLELAGMTEIRDGPLSVEGHLTDAHPGLAVEVAGALGEFHIELSGKIADPIAVDGADIAFVIGGPSMEEAGAAFDLPGLPGQPYKVSGQIRRFGKDLTLNNGVFIGGQGRMTVAGRLPNFPGIDDWALEVASTNFNLGMFGPLLGVEGLPAIPYDINGTLSATDEGDELVDLRIHSTESSLLLNGVVGGTPDYLGSHIKIKLHGTDMAYAGLWLGLNDLPSLEYWLSGEVFLSDMGWRLSDGLLTTRGLHFGVNAQIDKLPGPTAIMASLDLNSKNFKDSAAILGFESEGFPALPLSITGELSGSPEKIKIDKMTADLGKSQMKLSGVLGDPASFSGLALAVRFTSPDVLKALPSNLGDILPQVPVDARGHVTMSEDGLGIDAFKGTFANATVALSGLYNLEPGHNNSHFALDAGGPDLNRILAPWFEQKIAKKPFQLSLDVALSAGGLQLERFEAAAEGVKLGAKFDIDNIDTLTGARGNIEISGASSLQLAQLLGVELDIPDADFSLKMEMKHSADFLQLNPVVLQWGEGDLTGTVNYRPGNVPVFEIDMHSRFVSVPFLLAGRKTLESEKEARGKAGNTEDTPMQTEKLTKSEATKRIIPDDPLDFSWLRSLQGSIKYRVDELYVADDTTSSATVNLTIADGVLSASELSWGGNFVVGDAEFTVRALDKGAEIDGYLNARRIPLMLMLGGQPKYDPDAFYRLGIKTAGGSFREMANNAEGALVFSGGGGRMKNEGLDLLMGDMLEEIVDRLNPFRSVATYTDVICHAGAMSIGNGKIALEPGVVVRTKKMDMASGGTINLHKENLDLGFNTRSRRGIGISAGKAITPYFKVGGTMANPRLVMDPKGIALSGGAAVATGGLSILAEGLWGRWIASAGNPCAKLIDKISKDDKKTYRALLGVPSSGQ